MKSTFAAIGLAVLALSAGGAQAAQLITNGSFSSTTNGNGQLGYNTNATGWSTSGYNFLFASGTADTSGATGQFGNLKLWGPGDGSANGMPASSPDGGNFIAADGAFQTGAITQTITGLTAGASYTLSFYWAGAQQQGFDGPTTDKWTVSFGGQSQDTNVVSLATHGFSGWTQQTMTFTADATSDVLSFLATGTPSGVPPFALLDGVSMVATVPEPATWGLMLLGLVGIVGARAWRQRA